MRPLLIVGEVEKKPRGRWERSGEGRWKIGPFAVQAQVSPTVTEDGVTLNLQVRGKPPKDPYELRWLFDLPWKEGMWRGESGGGFVTPGPTEQGGASLLGITASIFACGEGLSALSLDGEGAFFL